MRFTIAPAIIQVSAGSVNKNFHYAPRGGALVQITPKFSSILLLFFPHYNNIIPKQQELVKVNKTIVEITRNSLKSPQTCALFANVAPLEPGFTDAAAANHV